MSARILLLLLCLLPLPAPAVAVASSDASSQPADPQVHFTSANLMNTLMRFGALDPRDDKILDNYALVTQCDLYQNFYNNDFKWNKVRAAIRESIKMNI